MRPLLILPLALLPAALLDLRGAAPPRLDGDAAHELVVLHPQRPYRVRLNLRLKGKAHDGDWNRVVEDLFRFLDADGDGRLNKAEAGRAPSREQWEQMAVGLPLEPDAGPDFAALTGGKAGATAADLKSWYRASTAGPFQVGWGWRARPAGALSDALWRHLDTDRDGKLSPAELKAAARVLDRLDNDEDELISQAEVMGFPQGGYFEPGPTFTRGAAHGPAQGGLPFFSRRLDEPAAPLVRAVLARYGKPGATALGPNEFRLGREAFAALDGDGDGRLDAAELARWAAGPPDVEVRVPLDPDGREPMSAVAAAGVAVRHEAGRLRLVVAGWWLDLDAGALPPVPARRQKAGAAQEAFRKLDFDGNGYLDSQELYRPPFHHVALLRLADRDGDGKVTLKEFTDFADLRSRMQHGTTFLRVEDRGRSLFRVLDTDGDGRLGIRERRDVWKRLGGLAAGPRGLARDALPQEYRVVLAHGERPAEFDGEADVRLRRRTAAPRGPLWFRKMDRNGDGDVSRAEWLGTAEQFRKIDGDGDGLISAEEAFRADDWFRKAGGERPRDGGR